MQLNKETNPGQSGLGSNGNEGALHISVISRTLRGVLPLCRDAVDISAVPAEWATIVERLCKYINSVAIYLYIYIYIYIF